MDDFGLNEISGLKWLPWIGEKYSSSKTRLLVLGESHYLWEGEEEAEDILNNINYTRAIIYNNHQRQISDVNYTVKHIDGLERMILNKSTISLEEKRAFSNNFAYHVIVQRGLSSLKERPKYSDYEEGWKVAIDIIKKLDPNYIIIIGVEAVNYLNESILKPYRKEQYETHDKISNTVPRTFELKYANKCIKCISIKHTSRFFSWGKWNSFIQKYFDISSFKSDIYR